MMLVTFSSPVSADITMFGDVALRLIKLMGHSGTIPGALAAEDVAPALQGTQVGEVTLNDPSGEEIQAVIE